MCAHYEYYSCSTQHGCLDNQQHLTTTGLSACYLIVKPWHHHTHTHIHTHIIHTHTYTYIHIQLSKALYVQHMPSLKFTNNPLLQTMCRCTSATVHNKLWPSNCFWNKTFAHVDGSGSKTTALLGDLEERVAYPQQTRSVFHVEGSRLQRNVVALKTSVSTHKCIPKLFDSFSISRSRVYERIILETGCFSSVLQSQVMMSNTSIYTHKWSYFGSN